MNEEQPKKFLMADEQAANNQRQQKTLAERMNEYIGAELRERLDKALDVHTATRH